MKKLLLVCGLIIISANSRGSETVFGPSTIRVGTNEAILLTTIQCGFLPNVIVDGVDVTPRDYYQSMVEHYSVFALAGPLEVGFAADISDSNFFVTFQRLTNSPIKTIMTDDPGTNFIEVPAGKTIQFFPPLGSPHQVEVQPRFSTNWFSCFSELNVRPSISGPATVRVDAWMFPTVLSYYFTDVSLRQACVSARKWRGEMPTRFWPPQDGARVQGAVCASRAVWKFQGIHRCGAA